jgi:replicative DNA helicase
LILLTEGSAKLFDLESFCRIVAEKHRLRLLYIANRDMEQRIIQQDRSLDIITDMQTSLLRTEVSMPQMKAANPAQIVDAVEGGVNGFLSPARDAGIMTWWPRFNHATNGLRRGRLYAIGAKPGIGKTSLACNIALAAVFNGHRTKIDTYEMSKEEYLFRLACTMALVDSQRAEAGYLNREERGRLADALRQIVERSAFLEISDSDNETTASIAAYLRKEKAAGRPFALQIIDYLQKMSGIGRFERREQEVAQVSGGLKKISHKMKIPVVALAQLSTSDREMYNHQPSVDDFRESKGFGSGRGCRHHHPVDRRRTTVQ